MAGDPSDDDGELAVVRRLAEILGPVSPGEIGVGDDAAVLGEIPGAPLFATDALVEGTHFTRAFSTMGDVGWKALAVNLSDLAAMGGRSLVAVVAVCGASAGEIEELYHGLTEVVAVYGGRIVGGDLSAAKLLCVTVSVIGTTDGRPPVLRSGARPGDRLYVTAPLGASAAGLRQLQADPESSGELVSRHRRPRPRLAEGLVAAELGATAMLDLSDGLGVDLERLVSASGVGAELSELPVHVGATESEALGGGEDYELLFTAPPTVDVAAGFAVRGLLPPIAIGEIVGDTARRSLHGEALPLAGYLHQLGA